MVYAIWHGGINYAKGEMVDTLERFDSVQAAADALRDRANNGHWSQQTFDYVHRETANVFTPVADVGARMTVYLGDDVPTDGDVADRYLELTPRGAIRDNIGRYYR